MTIQQAVARCGQDLQAIMRCVVDGAAGVVPASEHAAITTRSDGVWVCRVVRDPHHAGAVLAARHPTPAGPVLIGDARLDPRADAASCNARGIRSLLLAPVPHRAGIGAVLELASSRPDAFCETDAALAQLLAGMIAAGLATALPSAAELLQNAADRVETLGLDGRILSINPAGLDLLGLTDAAGLIGTDWLQHWPLSQQAAATAALDAARAGQTGRISAHGLGIPRRWWDVRLTLIEEEAGIEEGEGSQRRLLSVARDLTELHDAAERVEFTLDAGSVIGIGVWEPGFLSIDDRLAAAFGIPAGASWQDVEPSDFLANVHAQDHESLRALGRKASLGGGELRASFRIRDGRSWRWVEACASMVSGENNQLLRLTGVLIDIDARKRAELELAQNERTVRHIADQLPFLIAFVAPDLTYRFANCAYGEWFGAPRGGFAGRRVRRLFGEPVEDGTKVLLERAMAGEAIRFDRQFPRRDGVVRDIEVRYLPRWNGDGEVDGCYAIGTDITQRKEEERSLNRCNLSLEQSLAVAQQESERVWRLARDLLTVMDSEGRLRSFNPAWQAVLGWPAEVLHGRRFPALLHPDDVERTRSALALMAETGGLSGLENRWQSRDGGCRWLSWNAVLVDGLIYAAGRDVTAERDSALRLQRAEEQLRQSQKMEAVGQLTGGIAHDFNNLLTGVIGSIEMMRNRVRQGRTGELGRYLDAASGAAERAASLTHRLLAFSRRQTLEPKPVAADRLVAGMEELLCSAAGPTATLQIVRHPGLWTILCDPRQLEAALLNLANNARDAMPDGGRLAIETVNTVLEDSDDDGEVPAGEYVGISATDTGVGMSAVVLARAFDPFFTTKPIGRGSGLGLSMIYGFARQSGGHARILSTQGQGARVTIFLPRYRGPDGPLAEAEPALADPVSAGRAVLIIEDEPIARMVVGKVLAELGCTAVEALDARGALRALQGDVEVDLLITGIDLRGEMGGRQLAEAARLRRPGLKVLFISAGGQDSIADQRDGDAVQVIGRTRDVELLKQRVRSMMAD